VKVLVTGKRAVLAVLLTGIRSSFPDPESSPEQQKRAEKEVQRVFLTVF